MEQQKTQSPEFECIWSNEYLESFAIEILTENEMDSSLKTSFVRIFQEAIKISSDYYQFQRRSVHLASLALLKDHILTFKSYKQQYEQKSAKRQEVRKKLESMDELITSIEYSENSKKIEIEKQLRENQKEWLQQQIDDYLSIMHALTNFNQSQPSFDLKAFLLSAISDLNAEIQGLKTQSTEEIKKLRPSSVNEIEALRSLPQIMRIQCQAYFILYQDDEPMSNFLLTDGNKQEESRFRQKLHHNRFLQQSIELVDRIFSIELERIKMVKQLIKSQEFDLQRAKQVNAESHILMMYTVDLIRIYDKMNLLKKYEQLQEENKNEECSLDEFKDKLSNIIRLKQQAMNESRLEEVQTKLDGIKVYLNKVLSVKKITSILTSFAEIEKDRYQMIMQIQTEFSILMSSLIVYSTAFDKDYQQSLYENIIKVFKTETSAAQQTFIEFVEESEISPIEHPELLNMILGGSNKPKILIDPYTYGKQWLKLQPQTLECTIYGHSHMNDLIKQSQQNSTPILIEKLKVNFDQHQFHNQPQIWLSTILENPDFDSEIFNNFTVVNFNMKTIDAKQQLAIFETYFKQKKENDKLQGEEEMKIIEIFEMTKDEEQLMIDRLAQFIEENSETFDIALE